MIKDKLLLWFYLFLGIVFTSIYYSGEARNRRLLELGFTLCEINGIETWSTSCPQEKNFLDKYWSK